MSGGTPSTRKRELVETLNQNTMRWETTRQSRGKWFATARTNRAGRPYRASATSECQAMENLCKRLGLM